MNLGRYIIKISRNWLWSEVSIVFSSPSVGNHLEGQVRELRSAAGAVVESGRERQDGVVRRGAPSWCGQEAGIR